MKPKLPPGLYQLRTGRTYSDEELKVIGNRNGWYVVVRATLKKVKE